MVETTHAPMRSQLQPNAKLQQHMRCSQKSVFYCFLQETGMDALNPLSAEVPLLFGQTICNFYLQLELFHANFFCQFQIISLGFYHISIFSVNSKTFMNSRL